LKHSVDTLMMYLHTKN